MNTSNAILDGVLGTCSHTKCIGICMIQYCQLHTVCFSALGANLKRGWLGQPQDKSLNEMEPLLWFTITANWFSSFSMLVAWYFRHHNFQGYLIVSKNPGIIILQDQQFCSSILIFFIPLICDFGRNGSSCCRCFMIYRCSKSSCICILVKF